MLRTGTSDLSFLGIRDSCGNGPADFTGREYDSFTELNYYRARMYDPQLGRFISEDPIGFEGGDVNLYGYVWNNPLNFRDPLGLFPSMWRWKMHQQIGKNALAGLASPAQIEAINQANQSFDARTQDSVYAPYHAMRRYGQSSVEDARSEANDFVRQNICLARSYASRGLNLSAMEALGRAMHTMQDAESPAHAGFQEAWPNTRFFTAVNAWHYVKETFFAGEENVAAAEKNTQRAWMYFSGAPMPGDFFSNSGSSENCECR